jgi:uncharacterized protein (TIGR02996 family)
LSLDELEALWRQVRANPRDAAVLTVLADALIEAGDPRGELMSVQLDTETARGHDLLALRQRERDLLAQLRDRLLAGLPTGSYQIRRGLVAVAQLGGGFVTDAVKLAMHTHLDELWLRLNFDPLVVKDHPAVRHVRTLVYGIPKNVSPTPLGLPCLEELRVLAGPAATCALVKSNPTIKRVTLDRVRLDEYASLARILPQLVQLKLRTWIPPNVMRELVGGAIEHLEVLRVPGHETGRYIARLVGRDLPKLRELDLRGVDLQGATLTPDPMTDAEMAALAASPLRPKKLAVGVTQVTAAGLRAVIESPLAAELAELVVESIPLGNDDLAAISRLPKLARLHVLKCNVSDAARKDLVSALGGDVVFDDASPWIEQSS